MPKLLRLALVTLITLASIVVLFFVAAVLNGPYHWWQSDRLFHAHRQLFETAVQDVVEKGIVMVDLAPDGSLRVSCGDPARSCPSPKSDTESIIKKLGFEFLVRDGKDVFFAKDSGYEYHMGIVKFADPPAKLQGRKFEYRNLDDNWYLYTQP